MRRKQGALTPLEHEILNAAINLHLRGTDEVHGYQLAREMKELAGAHLPAGHGSLYKALGRLQEAGMLTDRWEDPETAAAEDRPRRRFYQVTSAGAAALANAAVAAQVALAPKTLGA